MVGTRERRCRSTCATSRRVGVGRELRTGSASENGEEVVVGTALMLIGANSRTVAAAVDAKIARDQPELCRPTSAPRRCSTAPSWWTRRSARSSKNLIEGAILVIVVLFLLLGNIRAALITRAGDPAVDADDRDRHGAEQDQRQPDEPGRDRLRPDRRRRGHHRRELPAAARRAPARARAEADAPRSGCTRSSSPRQGDDPARPCSAQAIIITVYLPILALTGVEGKMFHPMAMTVIFALAAAFVLSLTFVPAMVAIVIRGRVKEKENFLIRWAKRAVRAGSARRAAIPLARRRRRRSSHLRASLLLFTRLGQEFVPTLDEKDIAMHAMRIPSTGITQSTAMQNGGRANGRRVPRGRVRLLEDRHRRDGVRPDAAERLRHVHHPEAQGRVAGSCGDEGVPGEPDRAGRRGAPGQQLRVHPADPDALQRADRRRARRRGGEGLRRRFRALESTAQQIAAALRERPRRGRREGRADRRAAAIEIEIDRDGDRRATA